VPAPRGARGARHGGGGYVAVIPLTGLITARGSFLSMLFGGGGGLLDFRDSFREALNSPEVSAIVLDVDSPGGYVDLVPETAEEIYEARGEKPIVAVANTMAASAAYWPRLAGRRGRRDAERRSARSASTCCTRTGRSSTSRWGSTRPTSTPASTRSTATPTSRSATGARRLAAAGRRPLRHVRRRRRPRPRHDRRRRPVGLRRGPHAARRSARSRPASWTGRTLEDGRRRAARVPTAGGGAAAPRTAKAESAARAGPGPEPRLTRPCARPEDPIPSPPGAGRADAGARAEPRGPPAPTPTAGRREPADDEPDDDRTSEAEVTAEDRATFVDALTA
jgi:hypothetical protein